MAFFIEYGLCFFICCFGLTIANGQVEDGNKCNSAKQHLYSLDITKQPAASIIAINELLSTIEGQQCRETTAACHSGLSAAYYYTRDYVNAKQYALSAFDLSKVCCANTEIQASAMANLAAFIDGQRAIELLLASLKIEEQNGSNIRSLAYALEDLGLSYQKIGDYDTAINYYLLAKDKVFEHFKKASHEEARLLQQIGDCQKAKKDYSAALQNSLACLEILKGFPNDKFYLQTRWYAQRCIAELYLLLEQPDKAKKYIQQAINLQKGKNLFEAYQSWLTLGDVYSFQEKYAEAIESYQSAYEVAQAEFNIYNQHEALAKPKFKIAEVLRLEEKYQAALTYYQEALINLSIDFQSNDFKDEPLEDQFTNPLAAIEILQGKAKALEALHLQTADEQYLLAAHNSLILGAKLIQALRQQYLTQGSKHTLINKVHPLYTQAIAVALQLYELKKDPAYGDAAFYFAENNKAVLLYEEAKNKSAKTIAGIPDSILKMEKLTIENVNFLKKNILEEQQKIENEQNDQLTQWKQDLQLSNKKLDELVQEMELRYPLYKSNKFQTNPTSISTIQNDILNDHSLLIEYVVGEKYTYAFFISKKQNILTHRIPTKAIEAKVRKLLSLISDAPNSSEDYLADYRTFSPLAHSLYTQLIAPGLQQLDKPFEQLLIIPDGIMNYLPFEVLLTANAKGRPVSFQKDHLPYLFEEYKISYNYSASMAAVDPIDSGPRRKNFIGLAPSFVNGKISSARNCSSSQLIDLVCNQEEVANINALFDGEAYTGRGASRAVFEQAINQYTVVHLATHACLHESEQSLNKIFFSNEEYITQSELNGLNMLTDLTVLSACNTGSGQLLRGEGVMSLARCFMMAGSKSMLTSLWSVDDCTTAELMNAYYRNLKQGAVKDAALQQSKINFLERADLSSAHPYYWAAFVQIGSNAPISFNGMNDSFWKLGMISIGLFLFLLVFFRNKKG